MLCFQNLARVTMFLFPKLWPRKPSLSVSKIKGKVAMVLSKHSYHFPKFLEKVPYYRKLLKHCESQYLNYVRERWMHCFLIFFFCGFTLHIGMFLVCMVKFISVPGELHPEPISRFSSLILKIVFLFVIWEKFEIDCLNVIDNFASSHNIQQLELCTMIFSHLFIMF